MELPVMFHNFKGYDSHHIIKYALNQFKHCDLKPKAKTMERFLVIFVTIRFIDSYQFSSSSLSVLTENIESWPITSAEFQQGHLTKGNFPYKFATSYEMLVNQTSLPARWSEISEQEYEMAKSAWAEFDSHKVKELMLYYMKLEIYLLAYLFQKFQEKCLDEHGLKPLRFVSLPGLSWSSVLKTLDQPIELLQDPEMYWLLKFGFHCCMTFVKNHHVHVYENTSALY